MNFQTDQSSQNGDKELLPNRDNGGADFTRMSPTFPYNQIEDAHGMPQSSKETPLPPFGSDIGLADPGPTPDNIFQLPEIDWDHFKELYPDFSATDWNLNACQLQVPENAAPAANVTTSANAINCLEDYQTDQYSLLSTNDVIGDLRMSGNNGIYCMSDLQSPCLLQNQMTQSDGAEILDGSLLSLEVGDSRGTLSNHTVFNDSIGLSKRAQTDSLNFSSDMLCGDSNLQNIGSGMSCSTHNGGGLPRLSQNLAGSSNLWQNPGVISQQSQNINDFSGQTDNLGWFCNPTMSDTGLLHHSGNIDVFPSQVQNVSAFGLPRNESDGTLLQVVQQQPSCSVPGFLNLRAMLSRNAGVSATNLSTNVHSSPSASSVPHNMNHIEMHGYGQNGVSRSQSSSLGKSNTQSALDQIHMEKFSSEPCLFSPFLGAASRITSHTQSDNPGASQTTSYIQHTQNVNTISHVSDQAIQTVDGSLRTSGVPYGYASKRGRTESVPAIPHSRYKRARTSKSSSLLLPTQSAPSHVAPAGTAPVRPSSAQSAKYSGSLTAQTAPCYVPPAGTAPLGPFLARTTAPFHEFTPRIVLPQASSASTAQSGPNLVQTSAPFHQLTPRTVLAQASSASTAPSGPTLARTTMPFHQSAPHIVLPKASSASAVPPCSSPPLPSSPFCQTLVHAAAPFHQSTLGIVLRQASSASSLPLHPFPSQSAAPSRPSLPPISQTVAKTARFSSLPRTIPLAHIKWKGAGGDKTPEPSGKPCHICKRDLSFTPDGPVYQPANPPPVAILACHHHFHAHCLELITPENQAQDPPCIPCAIGEKN